MLVEMAKDEVLARVAQFRGRLSTGLLTNYYQQPLIADRLPAVLTDEMFAFLDYEHGFYRLFFYAHPATASFDALLAAHTAYAVVLSYPGKGELVQCEALALRSGFTRHAVYHRYAGYYNYQPVGSSAPSTARPDELEPLHAALLRDCDMYCDHPLTQAQLAELIAQGQVLVSRRDCGITGYFIYQVMGVKGYMNFWFGGDKADHLGNIQLLLAFYQQMRLRDIKYVFAWVNSRNSNVINIHKKFGLQFDGLTDFIYVRKPADSASL